MVFRDASRGYIRIEYFLQVLSENKLLFAHIYRARYGAQLTSSPLGYRAERIYTTPRAHQCGKWLFTHTYVSIASIPQDYHVFALNGIRIISISERVR